MKRKISRIYHINPNWWDSFTSCFVGTLLGIALTFGISGYLSRSEHRRNERIMQIIAVGKIEHNIYQLKLQLNEMMRSDSIYNMALDYYPDSIDRIPAKLMLELLKDVLTTRPALFDHSVSNVMLGNAEVWESMSPATINVLDRTLLLTGYIMKTVTDVQEMKDLIMENISSDHYIYSLRSIQEISHAFFDDPQNAYILSSISSMIRYANGLLPSCDSVMKQVRLNMDISDKDLEILRDSRYTGFKIMGDGVMSF